MISLPCASCKKLLEIDDAFAGGVCRCQHCGTIQTVPSSVKRAGAAAKPAKTLYQRKPHGSSGESSAAASAGATSAPSVGRTRAAAPVDPAAAARKSPVVAIAIAAVTLALIVVVIIWFST
ncbi:MAG: hypothetical protein ABIP55_03120 [Tepidisphaeraceae bacterium]